MAKRNIDRDGLERLRAINPVDESEVEGPDSPRAQELLTTITSIRHDTTPSRRTTSKQLRLVLAVVAVALATTAAVWIWTRTVTTPNVVSCYQAVDLDADIAAAPSGGAATADACAPVWERGELNNPDLAPVGSVPPLTACVADNGSLSVFPTDDTTVCRSLGLAYPEPAGQEGADTLREAEDQLITYFQSQDCIPLEEAQAEVRRILDESGLIAWTIHTHPENIDRPCASFSFDPAAEVVKLIPVPND